MTKLVNDDVLDNVGAERRREQAGADVDRVERTATTQEARATTGDTLDEPHGDRRAAPGHATSGTDHAPAQTLVVVVRDRAVERVVELGVTDERDAVDTDVRDGSADQVGRPILLLRRQIADQHLARRVEAHLNVETDEHLAI